MNEYKHTLDIINLAYNIIENAIHDNNLHLPWAAMVCKPTMYKCVCEQVWRMKSGCLCMCVCKMLHLWSPRSCTLCVSVQVTVSVVTLASV